LFAALSAGLSAKTFESGSRVCFLGDSITHNGIWSRDVMLYYVTRFPDRDIVFINAGQGGDNAYNARVARLETDVVARRPTDIVLMFGMNDVMRTNYMVGASAEQIALQRRKIDDYGQNIRLLLKGLREKVPGARLYCMTPSPFDDSAIYPKPTAEHFGADGGIAAEAQHLVDAANELGLEIIDQNATLNAYFRRRRQTAPKITFSADRVHPNNAIHFFMACTFLKAQSVSPIISDVRLMEGRILGTRNASVSDLVWKEDVISFRVLEKALPWPTTEAERDVVETLDIGDDFNQQNLAFTALPKGRWTLRIDGKKIVTADERAWAAGVNLGVIRTTPQYEQALKVYAKCAELYKIMIDRQADGFALRRSVDHQMKLKKLNPASAADRAKYYAVKRPTLKGSSLRVHDLLMEHYDNFDTFAAECDGFSAQLRDLAKPTVHAYELIKETK